jgi:hypothetical protein
MLAEMDEEFGIGDLMKEEFGSKSKVLIEIKLGNLIIK